LALPYEILATLIASVTFTLITLIQIIALTRGNKATSGSSSPTLAVIIQMIFGMLVCAGFAWWTFNLITIELFNWAAVSGCFALVGFIMPIIIWKAAQKNGKALADAQAANRTSEPTPFAEASTTEAAMPHDLFADMDFNSATSSSETVEATPPNIDTAPASTDDLSALRALVLATLPNRPTDATLQRHYDQQVAAAIAAHLNPQPAPTAYPLSLATAKKTATPPAKVLPLPQDSILRRHTLALMRSQLEAKLPVHPSDSVLKRHYAQLLEIELEKTRISRK
jgi:hypothetical protein